MADTPRYKAGKACALVAGAILSAAAGFTIYAIFAPRVSLVALQWAGSAADAGKVVGANAAQFRTALKLDLVLLFGYTVGLLAAAYVGWRVFWTDCARRWAAYGMGLSIGAGVFNLLQDALLGWALRTTPPQGTWIFRWAEALSFAKFSALVVAAPVAVVAVAVTAGRLVHHHETKDRWETALRKVPDNAVILPPLVEVPPAPARRPRGARSAVCFPTQGSASAQAHWAVGYGAPGAPEPARTGICLSGGGVRAATVALGALQSLRKELADADVLVSVSGGGYTAGAFRLALQKDSEAGQNPPAADVFAPGSPEEDHLRRHSSYISDTLGQWVVALAVLLRGVLSSLVLIGLTVTCAGMAVGRFYRQVPVVAGGLDKLRPLFLLHKPGPAPRFPPIPWGVTLAIGVAAAAAALTILLHVVRGSFSERPTPAVSRLATMFAAVTALLALTGVAAPAAVWLSSWLTWHAGWHVTLGRAVTAGALSATLSFLGAVAATLWRKRAALVKEAGTVRGVSKSTGQVLPNSMVQMLIIWLCLAVLVLVMLLLSGWAAASGLDDSWWALVPAGALVAGATLIDQTRLSMHPFYRGRLASAFAVRRVRRNDVDVAEPYRYTDLTKLSKYGDKQQGFPHVVFAATANINGQDLTPPGRRAVLYTLASDYVGGPQVGWVKTSVLEELAGPGLRRDLTVQAAMAISGAAFASAMGRQTRGYQLFLTLVNARLGAWMPHPRFVALKQKYVEDWTIPGLPRVRRLSYLAREIFGIHPATSRLLLCTDGGHYDNLGLLELLRRRCGRIYCIDASGDQPPLAVTLAGTIALAREELGVDISPEPTVYNLVPDGRQQSGGACTVTGLKDRLSAEAVTTIPFTYPALDGKPIRHGEIIFAKATLTPKMPYHLLAFTQDNPGFPRDATSDQWFNGDQFDEYQELGRYLGKQAADMGSRPSAGGAAPVPAPGGKGQKVQVPVGNGQAQTPGRRIPHLRWSLPLHFRRTP